MTAEHCYACRRAAAKIDCHYPGQLFVTIRFSATDLHATPLQDCVVVGSTRVLPLELQGGRHTKHVSGNR